MQLIQCLYYYYQRSICFGRFFRPSSGAYKTVCAALGIVMLSCCLPLVWMGCSNPTEQHLVGYKKKYPEKYFLIMSSKPARNM